MSTATVTELPDHFENQEAMEELVDKVYKEIETDKASGIVGGIDSPRETPRSDATEKVTGDVNSAGGDTAVENKDVDSDGQNANLKPEPELAGKATVQDWLDDDLRKLAADVGIPESKIGEFGSRQELERVFDIFDARAIEAGKKQFTDNAALVPAEVAAKAEEKKPLTKLDDSSKQPGEDVSKFLLPASEFDDKLAEVHNSFVSETSVRIKALETVIAGFQQQEAQRQTQSVLNEFSKAVDSIGQTELFGSEGNRTKEQSENYARLWDAHRAHVMGLRSMGRPAGTDKTFVERALYSEFGQQITKNKEKQVIDRLQDQSKRKMGGPSGKPVKPTGNKDGNPKQNDDAMADLKALYKHLESGGTKEDFPGA